MEVLAFGAVVIAKHKIQYRPHQSHCREGHTKYESIVRLSQMREQRQLFRTPMPRSDVPWHKHERDELPAPENTTQIEAGVSFQAIPS